MQKESIIVALPYLVTEVLVLEASQANRLYGFAEGALAAGGLFERAYDLTSAFAKSADVAVCSRTVLYALLMCE